MAYRSAADQDTATASSIAAALLSYYTIAQVDGLLANKLGVTEAASALQIAVRFPDDGGADKVVAIGEQILGPTVKLEQFPQQRLQRGPGHAHRGSRRGRLHPGESCSSPAATGSARPPTSWCTCPRPTTSTTHCTAASRERAPGARPRCTSPCRQTEWRSCWNGGRLRPPDPGRNTAASALLLKHEFLDGGADDVTLATLGEVLLEPTLTTLGNFLVRSNSSSWRATP